MEEIPSIWDINEYHIGVVLKWKKKINGEGYL